MRGGNFNGRNKAMKKFPVNFFMFCVAKFTGRPPSSKNFTHKKLLFKQNVGNSQKINPLKISSTCVWYITS